MYWNKWVRQPHHWLSIVFTLAVIISVGAVGMKRYTNWAGLLAVVSLALLHITGVYLFVLPRAASAFTWPPAGRGNLSSAKLLWL